MTHDLASLTELSTLEHLVSTQGVEALLAALDSALAQTPEEARVLREDGPTVGPKTLRVLRKAVALDADFLRAHPEALFQCLYNRLRWYDAPDAAAHYSGEGAKPWSDPEAHLYALAAQWRRQREAAGGAAPWVESLLPLRGASRAWTRSSGTTPRCCARRSTRRGRGWPPARGRMATTCASGMWPPPGASR
ncbi:hypothetical protein ACLESO_02305 [Pyxidicoccus sp. 3LG]